MNSFDPVDLPNRRQSGETIPARELRLSASTVDLPSNRTISTVTNPEYEQSHSISSQHRSENQVDNDHSDDEAKSARNHSEIARILSKTLSQEIGVDEQTKATQYLDSILRGNEVETPHHIESHSPSLTPSSSIHHDDIDEEIDEEDQEVIEAHQFISENNYVVEDLADVNSEISENSVDEHETVLDLSKTLEDTQIESDFENANMYERLKVLLIFTLFTILSVSGSLSRRRTKAVLRKLTQFRRGQFAFSPVYTP